MGLKPCASNFPHSSLVADGKQVATQWQPRKQVSVVGNAETASFCSAGEQLSRETSRCTQAARNPAAHPYVLGLLYDGKLIEIAKIGKKKQNKPHPKNPHNPGKEPSKQPN